MKITWMEANFLEACRNLTLAKEILAEYAEKPGGARAKKVLEILKPDFNQKPVIARKRTYTRRANKIRGYK